MRELSALMRRALLLLGSHKGYYLISRRDRIVWMAENTSDTITRSTMAALETRGLVEPYETARGKTMVITTMGKLAVK